MLLLLNLRRFSSLSEEFLAKRFDGLLQAFADWTNLALANTSATYHLNASRQF